MVRTRRRLLQGVAPTVAVLGALLVPAAPALAGGPVIAVLDSGADLHHPDLRGRLWTNRAEKPRNGRDDDGNGFVDDVHGADAIDGDGRPFDESPAGHGTHVAGLVARRDGRSRRPSGARVMPIRVLHGDGTGPERSLIRGIEYAVRHRARVINLSVSGYDPTPELWVALAKASGSGATIVVAAGNERRDLDREPVYPAAFRLPGFIVVAASERGYLTSFTSFGSSQVDLAAPGRRIWGPLPHRRWGYMTGTSQATAAVSRAAARILRIRPSLSGKKVRRAIVRAARKRPAIRGFTISGGVLDAHRAVRAATRIASRG